MRMRLYAMGLASALALLCACSPPPPAGTAAPRAAASDPKAAKDLAVYQQLLASNSYELAASIGQDLVARFPNSAQAEVVRRTLPEVQAKAKTAHESKRLALMWDYQSGMESGGRQNTAALYSVTPSSEAERIRLILRRHAHWGNSVYLYGRKPGFECAGECMVEIAFDQQPAQPFKAHLPETGEPALFITDDKAFLDQLAKARTIRMDLALKGSGVQSVVFEVGGYDAKKYPPL